MGRLYGAVDSETKSLCVLGGNEAYAARGTPEKGRKRVSASNDQANRMGDPRAFRGLDLLQPDVMTDEEWNRHAGIAAQPGGSPLPSYAVWRTLGRPDVYKRWMNQVYHLHNSESFSFSAYVVYYAIAGWENGYRYILKGCEKKYSKQTIVEMLAAGFLHSPTMGMYELAPVIAETLAAYEGPADPVPWPSNWKVEPQEFDSGLDFTKPKMTDEEYRSLEDWYVRVCGEVPGFVKFMGEHRPQVLKAWRARFENVVEKALPNQAFIYLLLHYEVVRMNPVGIRDNVLLARGMGLTKEQVVDCLTYGSTVFGGSGGYGLIETAVGSILADWI